MDNWLKYLIGTACLVVIAGGGHYAWDQRQESIATTAASRERTLTNGCRATLSKEGSYAKEMREYCVQNGYITLDQARRAERGDYLY